MKSPATAIYTAIKSALEGNVTYNGNPVKVFDYAPNDNEIPIVKGALHHYIEIGEISDTETAENADTFTHDATVDLYVVVGFPGIGSRMVVDDIVNQVMNLLQPYKGDALNLGTDFKNVVHSLEMGFETEQIGIHKTIIKTLRYRFTLDEILNN